MIRCSCRKALGVRPNGKLPKGFPANPLGKGGRRKGRCQLPSGGLPRPSEMLSVRTGQVLGQSGQRTPSPPSSLCCGRDRTVNGPFSPLTSVPPVLVGLVPPAAVVVGQVVVALVAPKVAPCSRLDRLAAPLALASHVALVHDFTLPVVAAERNRSKGPKMRKVPRCCWGTPVPRPGTLYGRAQYRYNIMYFFQKPVNE